MLYCRLSPVSSGSFFCTNCQLFADLTPWKQNNNAQEILQDPEEDVKTIRCCFALFPLATDIFFSFIASHESISHHILIPELNAFWWTRCSACVIAVSFAGGGEGKKLLSGGKIKPFRLLEEIQDFCEIHAALIQGYTVLDTPCCEWVSMHMCVCVASDCWRATAMGGSRTLCAFFSPFLTLHSRLHPQTEMFSGILINK